LPDLRVLPFALLFAGVPAREEKPLEFRPAQGTKVVKTIETALEIEQELWEWEWVGGGPHRWAHEADSRFSVAQDLVLRDEYALVGEGRPDLLNRNLERLRIRLETDVQGAFEATEDRSPLEGASVVFARDTESDELEVAYADSDRYRDEELIRGLRADVDFLGFLPVRAVRVGSTWRAPGRAVLDLVFPGGSFPFEFVHDDPREQLGDLGGIEDDLKVKLSHVFVRGSEEMAELRVRGDLEVETRSWIDEQVVPFFMIGYLEASVARTLETRLVVEGRLLWNLDLGRWESADFEGDIALRREDLIEPEDRLGIQLRDKTTWKGCFSLHATAEPAEDG
jgi:hypothetical protein